MKKLWNSYKYIMAIDPQLYLDIAANNVDPMVFEFDDLGGPGPMFGGVKITRTR
jgi:hypothetical protein